MHLPFVSLSRFDDMLREKNTQIGYRDRRIAELEAERRMLWDKICLLGIGAPVFAATNPGRSCDPEVAQQETAAKPVSHSSGKDEFIGHHRPSMIMRRMGASSLAVQDAASESTIQHQDRHDPRRLPSWSGQVASCDVDDCQLQKRSYWKFLQDEHGDLHERIFESNVRAEADWGDSSGRGRKNITDLHRKAAEILLHEKILKQQPAWLLAASSEAILDPCPGCGEIADRKASICKNCRYVYNPLEAYKATLIEYGHISMDRLSAEGWQEANKIKADRQAAKEKAQSTNAAENSDEHKQEGKN